MFIGFIHPNLGQAILGRKWRCPISEQEHLRVAPIPAVSTMCLLQVFDAISPVNEKSSYRRQRYSSGHELCHFLNPAHQPTSSMGRFACTSRDLSTTWLSTGGSSDPDDRHIRQETEANLFAIELLAPERLCWLYASPGIGHGVLQG